MHYLKLLLRILSTLTLGFLFLHAFKAGYDLLAEQELASILADESLDFEQEVLFASAKGYFFAGVAGGLLLVAVQGYSVQKVISSRLLAAYRRDMERALYAPYILRVQFLIQRGDENSLLLAREHLRLALELFTLPQEELDALRKKISQEQAELLLKVRAAADQTLQ